MRIFFILFYLLFFPYAIVGGALDLKTVVDAALAFHPQLREASENCQLARANGLYYARQFVPLISLGIDASRSEVDIQTMGSETSWRANMGWQSPWGFRVDRTLYGVEGVSQRAFSQYRVSFPLTGKDGAFYDNQAQYFWGAREAAEATYRHVKSLVVLDAVSGYWDWVGAAEQKRLSLEILAERVDMSDRLLKFVENQIRPSSDLLLAEVEVRQATIAYLRAQKDERVALVRISGFTGMPLISEEWEVGTLFPTQLLDVSDQASVIKRQDYRALLSLQKAKLAQARSAVLGLAPTWMLTAGVGVDRIGGSLGSLGSKFSEGEWSYQVGLGVDLPIWDLPVSGESVELLRIDQQFKRQLETLKIAIENESVLYSQSVKEDWEIVQLSNEAENDYHQIYENELRKMSLGVSTFLDVLTQRRLYDDVIFQKLISQKTYAMTCVKWANSTGNLVLPDGGINWKTILGVHDGN